MSLNRHACAFAQVLEYIEENMPPESAGAYGLHANAEVGFKRREAERFCAALACLQPRGAAAEGGLRAEERAKVRGLIRLYTRLGFAQQGGAVSGLAPGIGSAPRCAACLSCTGDRGASACPDPLDV